MWRWIKGVIFKFLFSFSVFFADFFFWRYEGVFRWGGIVVFTVCFEFVCIGCFVGSEFSDMFRF